MKVYFHSIFFIFRNLWWGSWVSWWGSWWGSWVGVGMVIKSRCNGKRRVENMVMRACRPRAPSWVKGQSPCSGSQRPKQPPWSWKILSFRTSTGSSTGTLPIYIYSKTLIMGEAAAWSADAWIRHCYRRMASGINIYPICWYQEFELLISTIRIVDIKNSNSWYQQIGINVNSACHTDVRRQADDRRTERR